MSETETVEPNVATIAVDDSLIHAVKHAARAEDTTQLRALTLDLHHADSAALIGLLSPAIRAPLIHALTPDFAPEILTYLDEEIVQEIMDLIGTEKIAEALAELETDDAVSVIEDLHEDEQQELLEAVSDEARADLEEGLAYPEESAGRLMQKRFVSVPEFWDVGKVIDHLREADNLPEDFYEIIVVSPRHHPVGSVMLSRIMRNTRETAINALMKTDIHPISIETDQEEVAEIFRRYGIAEAPVINNSERVVGVITIDDIVTVIKEEEEEDFMRAGGLLEQDIHAGLLQTVKQRLPWLLINLVTASLAAYVISRFESTIEQMVTLAVLMPVIASLSGNAGTQSLTVAVRGIATRELQRHNAVSIIRKEMLTNLLNGIMLSIVASGVIWGVYRDLELAAIFSAAIIGTLFVAGFAGAFIPLFLARIKVDPAIASSVFVTTLTDIVSFFSFLGLAAWLLL
ncbi:MAG: magnesium transporter [Rickettsiales bacterium]|nr:magnesium transporter [Rickettsiales bacterium]